MEISTSILNVNEEKITETFYNIEAAKTDYFHIDVMDGKFVKNNTVEKMLKYTDTLKGITNTPIEVHLMVQDVKKYIDIFIPNNPKKIIFHAKVLQDSKEILNIIKYLKENNIQVGLALNPEDEIEIIKEFLPYVDVIKVADNELEFLTGTTDINSALEKDFADIKVVLYTKGEHGAEVYYKDKKVVTTIPSIKAIDTTGAGDAFAGSFLSKLLNQENIDDISEEELSEMATFATNYASFTTTKTGAISSYLTVEEYKSLI